MKILFLTNYPSPYRVHFFNELGKETDLTVAFEEKPEDQTHRDKSWFYLNFENFKAIYLTNKKIGNKNNRNKYIVFCPSIKSLIKNGNFDVIITGGYATLTAMYAIRYMIRKKIPYWVEIDGGIKQKRNCIVRTLQKYFVSHATGYFSPSENSDNYLIDIGAKKNNIFRYPFTSLDNEDILQERVAFDKKNSLRKKLGIKEEKVVVAVGRFVYGKGFDILIKASEKLNSNVGVYIIGGNPTDEYLSLKRQYDKQDRIHYVGFKKKDELREYYQASDLFCMPTRLDVWGLVINEAMSNGLPIVGTDQCVAALELIDKSNGIIVPSEDELALFNAINSIIESDKLIELGDSSLKKIRKYTYSQMVKAHLQAFEEFSIVRN